jgi:hypothetical protein
MVKMSKALIRRSNLKTSLIDAAEQKIETEGLSGLRARSVDTWSMRPKIAPSIYPFVRRRLIERCAGRPR